MQRTFYKIRSPLHSYVAQVDVMSPLLHKVYVGGKKKCVAFSIYQDGSHPNLDAFSYHPSCNRKGTLPRGEGTKDLLRTALAFLHQTYGSTVVELLDQSKLRCAHHLEVPLIHIYLAKHGQTWYEAHFHATPARIPEYPAKVAHLKDTLRKHPRWKDLCASYHIPSHLQDTLQPIYQSAPHLQAFIDTLFDSMDAYVFHPWLRSLVDQAMGHDMYSTSWILPYVPHPISTKEIPTHVWQQGSGPEALAMDLTLEIAT